MNDDTLDMPREPWWYAWWAGPAVAAAIFAIALLGLAGMYAVGSYRSGSACWVMEADGKTPESAKIPPPVFCPDWKLGG